MNKLRKLKIESQLKRVIAMLILQEVRDDRVGFVTVTHVSLTNDYKQAHIYVSIMGDEKKQDKCMAGLKHAVGFIRSRVAEEIRMQYVPEMVFKLDDTEEHRTRVLSLLKEIEDQKKND